MIDRSSHCLLLGSVDPAYYYS